MVDDVLCDRDSMVQSTIVNLSPNKLVYVLPSLDPTSLEDPNRRK